jgi:hypothetical protein
MSLAVVVWCFHGVKPTQDSCLIAPRTQQIVMLCVCLAGCHLVRSGMQPG